MLNLIENYINPYWNLAAEEYLLKEFKQPVFRLWRNDNSIIVGQNQNTIAEIDVDYVKKNKIKVVRRLTGGGAVFHDLGNLNFTFIEDKRNGEDASAMFKRFTTPILEALKAIGINAYLEGRNDLLIDGCKFSGNAVCVHKNRILQHGTLLFSASMTNLSAALKARPEKFIGKAVQSNRSRVTNISEHLTPNTLKDFGGKMDIIDFKNYLNDFICKKYNNIEPYNYTEIDLQNINKLVEDKYSLDSWNFGKSPSYSFKKVEKLSGGIIEVYLNVKDGKISQLNIFGDYFFTKDTSDFISQMIGVEHNPNAIEKAIKNIDNNIKGSGNYLGIGAYFNGISISELVSIFWQSECESSTAKF